MEKQGSCKFCWNFISAGIDEDPLFDGSSIPIGSSDSGYALFLNSSSTYPAFGCVNIDCLCYSSGQGLTVATYVPKYCPECGRKLVENQKYFDLHKKNRSKNGTEKHD